MTKRLLLISFLSFITFYFMGIILESLLDYFIVQAPRLVNLTVRYVIPYVIILIYGHKKYSNERAASFALAGGPIIYTIILFVISAMVLYTALSRSIFL